MNDDQKKEITVIFKFTEELYTSMINQKDHHGSFDKHNYSTFSCLGLGSANYSAQESYERKLEFFTREALNNIFKGLFEIKRINCTINKPKYRINWEDTSCYESRCPFEFIFDNGERIGVRYESLNYEYAKQLKDDYNVDRIIQIKWKSKPSYEYDNEEGYDEMTPKGFFKNFFSENTYEIFIDKVKETIDKIHDEVGYDTVSLLTSRYLSDIKNSISRKFESIDFKDKNFMLIKKLESKNVDNNDHDLINKRISIVDFEIMNSNFKGKKLYKAIVGKEDYAKCYLSSEYLVRVFNCRNALDYTPIVSGYFKSVELLLYKLMKIRLSMSCDKSLAIKCGFINKNDRKKLEKKEALIVTKKYNKICFLKEYEDYFDTSLGSLINFVCDDVNGWYVSKETVKIIRMYLSSYAGECRNIYFHKGVIDGYNIVSRIRNNTELIVYLLLGGYKLSGNDNKDLDYLGIVDEKFNRMYKWIDRIPKSIFRFVLYFPNERKYAYRLLKQPSPVYDEYGIVDKSKIIFVFTDKFSRESEKKIVGDNQWSESEKYVFSKDSMPEKISYISMNIEKFFDE